VAVTTTRTSDLLDLRAAEVPRGVANAHPIFIDRASGAKMWDIEGNEYLDFAGGIGVLNVGHAHPKVQAAVAAQLQRFTHTCFQVTMYESYLRLAQRLNRLAPGAAKKKTVLFTTGAEATENAVKIARAYTNRPAVIAFHHGFHGRTLLALSMTGKSSPYKQNFGPFATEVYHTAFPYEHHGWTSARALASLHELFACEVLPDKVAAIIVEPVLGEGGFVPAPMDFLRELRAVANRYGIVLIADEVQTGFARTGTMFAIEHYGIEPDIIACAKSMGDGLPISAVIGRADIMDAPAPGGLGGTYGGNPLACAAALAVIDIIEQEGLFQRARVIGRQVEQRFRALQRRHRQIADVRALGAMVAMELRGEGEDGGTHLASRLLEAARRKGLILLSAGAKRDIIRVLVPLVISDGDLEQALQRYDETCAEVLS